MNSAHFAFAFLGGLTPALFWLWFLLREDKARPEPYLLIVVSFIAGMAVVPLVLPLQQYAMEIYKGDNLVVIWVTIEEVLKYAVALAVVLWHKAVDEPIDLIIYMITIALGFAALENALFIFTPLSDGNVFESILTGQFRFIGATLLHVLASGTVGAALALAYYKSKRIQLMAGMIGLGIAIVLHALFNLFIMDANNSRNGGNTILLVFLFVWMGMIVLFTLFEKVKLLEAKHSHSLYNDHSQS